MSSPVIIDGVSLSVDDVKYSAPKMNASGGKSIGVLNATSNKGLYLELPAMMQWGIKDWEGNQKYNMTITARGLIEERNGGTISNFSNPYIVNVKNNLLEINSLVFLIFLMVPGCINSSNLTSNYNDDSSTDVNWSLIDSIDINQINSDLVNGKPTVDIGIYFPSNLDSTFTKVTFNKMIESFLFAKEIFKPTDVQLNLLFAKTGNINSKYLSIQVNEVPGIPDTEYVNLYENSKRHPSIPTTHAINAFKSIIEKDINNSRTIYLIALQDVFYPFSTFG